MSILVAVCLACSASLPGQQASTAAPGLPQNPREILAAAAPFYDFSSASLKPWHLKATYQLYDEAGNPSQQGTYEYWWVSPQVNRRTWKRPGATHTDWHTADGKHAYEATGEGLEFFEYKLQAALLSPLPDPGDLDPEKFRLEREPLSLGNVKLPCVKVIPLMPQHGRIQTVPLGLFPTYCFDSLLPALRISYSFGTVATEFSKIVKTQNRYLPREIQMFEGKRKILTAEVETISMLDPTDASLTPSKEATVAKFDKVVHIGPPIAQGSLIKKKVPVYPQDAKDAQVSGEVLLRATIGRDGGVHDLHVISTPWPSLTASALWAVSHWQYKPYLLNGEPVEVETTVTVIFSLGP